MMECFRCNVVSKVTYRADVFISLSVLKKKIVKCLTIIKKN